MCLLLLSFFFSLTFFFSPSCLGNIYLGCSHWQIIRQDVAQRIIYFKLSFSSFVLQLGRSCSSWLLLSSAEANVSTGGTGVRYLKACGII